MTPNDSSIIDNEYSDDDDEDVEIEPVNPDKGNFIFGMHPLQPENVVIDPNYPPQFYPYLYPHLYPHLFPKLYPHYCKNYDKLMKNKKGKKRKHEKRDIVVVLPDRRNIMMSRKEFLAYQLALAQMGYKTSDKDLTVVKNDPMLEDSIDQEFSVALSANLPSETNSPTNKHKAGNRNKTTDPADNNKDMDNLLMGLDNSPQTQLANPTKPTSSLKPSALVSNNQGINPSNRPNEANLSNKNSAPNKTIAPFQDDPDEF